MEKELSTEFLFQWYGYSTILYHMYAKNVSGWHWYIPVLLKEQAWLKIYTLWYFACLILMEIEWPIRSFQILLHN